jgi:hypothetical protein
MSRSIPPAGLGREHVNLVNVLSLPSRTTVTARALPKEVPQVHVPPARSPITSTTVVFMLHAALVNAHDPFCPSSAHGDTRSAS